MEKNISLSKGFLVSAWFITKVFPVPVIIHKVRVSMLNAIFIRMVDNDIK